jgi:NAD(P)-dependent dehydrogenase (short-subunit alcohol dehydrogenase family)
MDQSDLTGRVAIVTGGGSGLGRECALEFAGRGASVAIASFVPDQNEAVAEECRALGVRAIAVSVDVSNEEAVHELVAKTVSELGDVDITVAAAGIGGPNPGGTVDADLGLALHDHTLAQWDRVMGVNVAGVFLTFSTVARSMIKADRGGTLMSFTSAVVRDHIMRTPGAYAVSKWSVEGLTKRFAVELAEHRIRVNVFQPGGQTHTPFLGGMYQQGRPSTRHEARIVRPVAAYLASDESTLVTGETLFADVFNRSRGIEACGCERCSGPARILEPTKYPIITT